jgi:ribosomal protein S18 acetylase RimI-like enzyme
MVEIRILEPGEEAILIGSAPDVFDGPVDPDLARAFLADLRHHIAVAIDAKTVVGFASGFDYIHPDRPAEFLINEVGVSEPYQRRGIGRAIMSALLKHAKSKGCVSAWVMTDETNMAARALYLSLGASEGADSDPSNTRPIGYAFDLERDL